MRLLPVAKIPDGATVARDVRASALDRMPMLSAGATLQPAYRRALERSGIDYLFVDDDISAGIEPVGIVPHEVRMDAIRAVAELLEEARRATMRRRPVPREAILALEPVAKTIVLEVTRRDPVVPTLGETGPPGDYLPAHSVDVTLLGVLMALAHQRRHGWIDPGTSARRYDVNVAGLQRLALALLLIDIGTTAVPRQLLEHPGPLGAEDRDTICRHVAHGIEMLPAGMSFVVQAVLRDHHERWDGSGYAEGRIGEDIAWEARLAAIADVYVATTSNRVYCEAALQHEGWSTIIGGAGTQFDPEIVEAFRDVVVPYAPATEVALPDGRIAVVARVDEQDPLRPVVRAAGLDGGVEELGGVLVQPVAIVAGRERAA